MKHSLLETNPEPGKKESLLTRCANVFSRWSQKYVPDAFVIAVRHFIYFHYSFVDESLKSVQNRKILGMDFGLI